MEPETSTPQSRIVMDVRKWQAFAALIVALGTIAGSVWTATKWAVRDQVDVAVDARMAREHDSYTEQMDSVRDMVKDLDRANATAHAEFASQKDLDNAKQLLDVRLQVLEKIADRVEFLYRREIQRSKVE